MLSTKHREKTTLSTFTYKKYGNPFPAAFARELKSVNAALQIAWEPDSLDRVQDDKYLSDFAEAIRKSGIPVFVRFASEMNGSWVPYHGDPLQYRVKFRLVANRIREIAPNAAMVWSPNAIPEKPIDDYYPGSEYVDWVGVNFYSVSTTTQIVRGRQNGGFLPIRLSTCTGNIATDTQSWLPSGQHLIGPPSNPMTGPSLHDKKFGSSFEPFRPSTHV